MLEIVVSYRQISEAIKMHAKYVLLEFHVHFVSPDLNALSAQRVCSTSVSAFGVCALCLSLEVLCVDHIKLFEPIFRDS